MNRCNILLLDEFRLISKDTIDTVLRKFLTQRRMPRYDELTEEERKREYDKEKNLTLYLSSAYWKDHWSYMKCVDTLKAMTSFGRNQFICGFPYQLSIKEGLLDPEMIEDELGDNQFSDVKFSMEMCAEFYGSDEGAFFDFNSISKNRKIKYPMLPDKLAVKLGNAQEIKIKQKANGEIRLISADIALMSSKKHKNDATAIFVTQMVPSKAGRYVINVIYSESCEGMRTEGQALRIRELYEEYMCDYIILDTAGLGLGVYDCLSRDIVDQDSGEIYPALSCYNNQEMASRCTVPGAKKAIWAIKASAAFNSDIAYLLRQGFISGRIRLLQTEYEAEALLGQLKGYNNLNPQEKVKFQMPYINTTLLIDELTKLQHEESGGKIRVYEKSGMRKDRYSSLAYNYYVAMTLENTISRRHNLSAQTSESFVIKPPSTYQTPKTGKAVNTYAKRHNGYGGWQG